MSTCRELRCLSCGVGALLIVLAIPFSTAAAADPSFEGDSSGTLLAAGESGYPDIPARGRRYLFPRNREQIFVSVQGGLRSMGGDHFNGEMVFVAGDEVTFIPDIEDAPAFGVYVEGRQAWWGAEIGYSYASHDWKYLDTEIDGLSTSSHFIDFNFKAYLLADQRIQPFGLLGFALTGIRVEDGKYNEYTDVSETGSLWGYGLNWGAGVAFYPRDLVQISAGARWHWAQYDRVSGADAEDAIDGSGTTYIVSVGFGVN